HRALGSFPTRRSSDLACLEAEVEVLVPAGGPDDAQLLLAADLHLEVGEVGPDGRAVGPDPPGHRVDELDLEPRAQRTGRVGRLEDRKSTRLNSSHVQI